jgi:beta-lactamase class A
MPQSTALQQTTMVQGQDTITDGQATGRSRRTDKNVLLKPRSRSMAIALYVARMLILSIGVGVLAGTVLSAWNPGNTLFLADASRQPAKPVESPVAAAPAAHPASAPLTLTAEIAPLKAKLQTLIQQSPGFAPGLFLIDLDNYNYLDITGSVAFPAASMIKIPILIAFFQDVDAGKIRLDEKLTMRKDMIAQGSGEMQYLPAGTQFTALETATQMIIVSDNTATNMLIARLGGIAVLNERFKSWGLATTTLKNVLPDLQGTNVASPKELASLMVRVSQGELVSMRSRDRMLSIMQRTVNNSQLPQGLGEGATIAHKTGDIGTLIGDVGLVDMPNGKRYAAAVMVKRSFNDDRAYELVQKMSSVIYQHLNGTVKGTSAIPASGLSPSPTPSASPNEEAEQGVETDAHHVPDSELPQDHTPAVADPDQTAHQ